MKIVYYTSTAFLDPALSLIQALSQIVEVHAILEFSPEGRRSALFDADPPVLSNGLQPAVPILEQYFPIGARKFWDHVASFHLAVHKTNSVHLQSRHISRQVLSFTRSLQPDIVHVDGGSLRLALGMPVRTSMPVVLGVHDPFPHTGEDNWRSRLAQVLLFRHCRHFVIHNQVMHEPFCARYRLRPEQVSVHPLGVYHIYREWIEEPVAEEPTTVLFFGRLSPYKGLQVLYDAAAIIAKAIPHLRLVVAGRPISGYTPPVPPCLPNGGHVELIDRYIPNAEAARLFQRATLVVCPYRDATQSGVVLTAYAFGKAVVATQVGGLADYIEDRVTGRLVPPGDPVALAQAIIAILCEPSWRQQLGDGVQTIAATRLSWQQIAERTVGLYQYLGSAPDRPLQAPWLSIKPE